MCNVVENCLSFLQDLKPALYVLQSNQITGVLGSLNQTACPAGEVCVTGDSGKVNVLNNFRLCQTAHNKNNVFSPQGKHQVTITGIIPDEAKKVVFTTNTGTYTTFFSADGSGSFSRRFSGAILDSGSFSISSRFCKASIEAEICFTF